MKKSSLLVTFVMLLLITLPVYGQNRQVSDDEVNAVAKKLYCPVCESTPLDVCPTQACADWRELIRTQLSEGKTEEEILAYFAQQYGDGVLAEPPRRGFGLLLWLFPIVAIVLGGIFFSRYMASLRETAVSEPVPPPSTIIMSTIKTLTPEQPTNDPYITRVEEELKKLD